MSDVKSLLNAALSLSAIDRAALAQQLLASLEDLSEVETQQLWAEEADRRHAEYRAGHAEARSADAVHERVRQLYE